MLDGVEYEYEVNAVTGKVTEVEVDGQNGSTDYGAGSDGVTDYGNTDYGAGSDGVTDYGNTDYGAGSDGVTDYGNTDYGAGSDGVTDYNTGSGGATNTGGASTLHRRQLRLWQLQLRGNSGYNNPATAETPVTATPAMMTNPPTVSFRHEDKHQIHPREDLVLAKRLRLLLPHDPYAGADGSYRVTSLYFDTPYDKALREKRDGVDRREKFRLRYYGTDTGFLRLEKKCKVHGLCSKRSARVTPEQVQSLLAGDYAFLLRSDHALLRELYSKLQGQCLRPKNGGATTGRPSSTRRAMCASPWTETSVPAWAV